jgi:hypothetical protein
MPFHLGVASTFIVTAVVFNNEGESYRSAKFCQCRIAIQSAIIFVFDRNSLANLHHGRCIFFIEPARPDNSSHVHPRFI